MLVRCGTTLMLYVRMRRAVCICYSSSSSTCWISHSVHVTTFSAHIPVPLFVSMYVPVMNGNSKVSCNHQVMFCTSLLIIVCVWGEANCPDKCF
jgi:hypothetical protein